jgi:hypothetical protein
MCDVRTDHVAHMEGLAKEKPFFNIYGIHEISENNFNVELLHKTLWGNGDRKITKGNRDPTVSNNV